MKKQTQTRFLTLMLALCLMITSLVLPTFADEGASSATDSIGVGASPGENATVTGEDSLKGSSAASGISADNCAILRYIDAESFEAVGHVGRLTQREALNTYVFANADGTRTVYYMGENVKYEASDGSIKEKDLTLKAQTDGFTVTSSDIGMLMPSNISTGVDLTYSGYSLKLTPEGASGGAIGQSSEGSVIYPNAFGQNTALIYTPRLSGIKEDIVIAKRVSSATFGFILETDGLGIYSDEVGYYLSEAADTAPIFRLGEVVVYDYVGKPDVGTMTVETLEAGNRYRLTLEVDEEYLTAANTVYPVTVDPSITVSYLENGSGYIDDATVYQGIPNGNFGSFVYNRVGTPSTSYGVGRTAVRLNALISANEYQSITANQITELKFYAKESSGGETRFVNLYALTENTSWTETDITWNNVGAYSTSVNYGAEMTNNAWTAFDITELARAWKRGERSATAGFIMISSNEALDKSFCSSEHANDYYNPYVVMTYEPTLNGGTNFNNATDITENSIKTTKIDESCMYRYFKFTPPETGFYTFESSSPIEADPYICLYNDMGDQLQTNDDGPSNTNFRLTYHLIGDIDYFFTVESANDLSGMFDIEVFQTTRSNYIDCTSTAIGSTNTVINSKSYMSKVFKFIPNTTCDFRFESMNNSGDPQIMVYDSSLNQIGYDDDSNGEFNFKLELELSHGREYFLVVSEYADEVGICVLKPIQIISYVHYYDSSVAGNSTYLSNILLASEYANKVFREMFGIEIRVQGSPTYFETSLENCTTGTNNPCSDATCGSHCDTHHKSTFNIAKQIFRSPREDNCIYVYWNDRDAEAFCNNENGVHTTGGSLACVFGNRPIIHVMEIPKGENNDDIIATMTVILAHETAHCFKMPDVYTDPEHESNNICIMNSYHINRIRALYTLTKKTPMGEFPFCSSCAQTIREHLNECRFLGNQEEEEPDLS